MKVPLEESTNYGAKKENYYTKTRTNMNEPEKDYDHCQLCGELWDSEYHISDTCVKVNKDQEK